MADQSLAESPEICQSYESSMVLLHLLTALSFRNALRDDTDLTIKLDCFTWRVHADVLARKSGFFRRICEGNNWKESNERIITLHDDTPTMFARLLQFVYVGNYCHTIGDLAVGGPPYISADMPSILDMLASSSSRSASDEIQKIRFRNSLLSESEIDLGVYDIADKYDIPSLIDFSLRSCLDNFDDLPQMSELFIQHYPDRLKQDPKLNEAVVKLIALNFNSLRADENEWTKGVGKWLKEDFEFCTMVMETLSDFQRLHGI